MSTSSGLFSTVSHANFKYNFSGLKTNIRLKFGTDEQDFLPNKQNLRLQRCQTKYLLYIRYFAKQNVLLQRCQTKFDVVNVAKQNVLWLCCQTKFDVATLANKMCCCYVGKQNLMLLRCQTKCVVATSPNKTIVSIR